MKNIKSYAAYFAFDSEFTISQIKSSFWFDIWDRFLIS